MYDKLKATVSTGVDVFFFSYAPVFFSLVPVNTH